MGDTIVKEQYTTPAMEIIEFESEDVITASLMNGDKLGDVGGEGDIKIP